MKLVGFFNRDGGTFKTTDMLAYEKRAEAAFREAGHDFDAIVFSGKEIIPAMERAAKRDDIDGIVAGGGDGTISAAASIARKRHCARRRACRYDEPLCPLAACAARYLAGA